MEDPSEVEASSFFFSASPYLLPGRAQGGWEGLPPPSVMLAPPGPHLSGVTRRPGVAGRAHRYAGGPPPRAHSAAALQHGRGEEDLYLVPHPMLYASLPPPPRGRSPETMGRSEKKQRRTGVYAGDLLPGHYLKTLTGTVRGEELFSRPDLPRPWRSSSQQFNAMQIAMKEREIESLMRLCSDLRTQLGNANHDAQLLEHTVSARMKESLGKKEEEMNELRKELQRAQEVEQKAKDDAEHQIRLLQAQHENQVRGLQTESRLLSERMVAQAKQFDQQLKDLKEIAAREVGLLETRFNVRVQELEAELHAVRSGATAAEQHYQSQLAEVKSLQTRVETAFADHRRNAEEKRDELQKVFDRSLQREREATCEAQREAREAKERMAGAVVDVEEIRHRFLLWSEWILLMLDAHHRRYAETCPAHTVSLSDPRRHELPPLYTPRCLQHDAESKLLVERVVLRLLQLEAYPIFPEEGNNRGEGLGGGGGATSAGELTRETEALQIRERQHQLRAGIRELEDRCRELQSTFSALRSRLGFFSDDLHGSSSMMYPQVQPPLPSKCTFVCLAVYEGNLLWATYPSDMQTAMTFLHTTLRAKRQEYGAYECYADGVCTLLAFEDVIAACRFAVDVQEWALRLPWPARLLREALSCATVYAATPPPSALAGPLDRVGGSGEVTAWRENAGVESPGSASGVRSSLPLHDGLVGGPEFASSPRHDGNPSGGGTLVFHGLRLGAAIHTGLCAVEDTAVSEWRHTGARTSSANGGGGRGATSRKLLGYASRFGTGDEEKEAEEGAGAKTDPHRPSWTPADGTSLEGVPEPPSQGVYRRHYYGRAILQTLYIASLAQGGQVLISDAVWNHPSTRSRLGEIAGMAVGRSLGRYAILSLDTKTGLEESQTMELFQLLPTSLAARRFLPTALLLQRSSASPVSSSALQRESGGGGGGGVGGGGAPGREAYPSSLFRGTSAAGVEGGGGGVEDTPNGLVKGLEKVKNFTIAVGISALENQHRAMEEGLRLLQGELRELHNKSEDMMEKARRAQSQFHLLPPPEMVLQLNELYRLLEEVAGMSEETTEDMKQIEMAQDELRTNLQGVREYLYRYLSDSERESSLKIEHEAALNQLDRLLKDVQIQRQAEIERLQLAVNERDQALQRIFQQR